MKILERGPTYWTNDMIYFSGLFTFFENIPSSTATCDLLSQPKRKNVCNFLKVDELIDNRHKVVSVVFSWSYCLLINDVGEAILVGYLNGKSNQILKLIPPDKGFIIQGACSTRHCHLVTRDGNYWLFDKMSRSWKNLTQILNAERPQLESGSNTDEKTFITNVACGNEINLAVDKSGGLFSVPSRLDLGAGVLVTAVACGKEHSLLLTAAHTVYSWGSGSRGQLGHGCVESEDHPREIAALCGLKVVSIAAGGWHCCCVTDQHDLYSWGWNCSGQLGFPGEEQEVADGKLKVISVLAEPTVVDWPADADVTGVAIYNVNQVSCGSRHTIAVLDDSSLWGCGWNRYHQLSGDLPESVFGMTKLTVPPNLKVERVMCGEWNSAFVAAEEGDGRL